MNIFWLRHLKAARINLKEKMTFSVLKFLDYHDMGFFWISAELKLKTFPYYLQGNSHVLFYVEKKALKLKLIKNVLGSTRRKDRLKNLVIQSLNMNMQRRSILTKLSLETRNCNVIHYCDRSILRHIFFSFFKNLINVIKIY